MQQLYLNPTQPSQLLTGHVAGDGSISLPLANLAGLETLGSPVAVKRIAHLIDLAVGISVSQEGNSSLDALIAKGTSATREVGSTKCLGTPALLHGVDEVSLLVVAKVGQGSHVEGGHHVVVLVDQVVAVEHVDAVPGGVVSLDEHLFVLAQPDDVLETGGLVGQDGAVAVALQNPKVDKVDVDGVGPAAGRVLELPDLDGSAGDVGEHAVVDVGKGDAVDAPLGLLAVEAEEVADGVVGDGLGERDGAQGRGDHAGVGGGGLVGDDEAHDLVRVGVVLVDAGAAGVGQVQEVDGLAGVLGKVKDDLVALGVGDVDVGDLLGGLEETGVGRDDLEGDLGAAGADGGKVQGEGARDGGVEEAEAVLARLDVQEGPGLAVDVDHVSPEAVLLTIGGDQVAV
ncbi:uncharacterized protein PgNI_02843 [Pyricularia grisea]|uniref:Uncharacterized protein n=1 Tax=Pyricularia grisea TaxID=148305 RepID=A0A6P8BAL0_PYRGI|nr:uncharacterized protein PgNI_02843 [Pyricularia grisea]TLD12853.1 hypothetical protein PgNI_02843 [Pyricularia grisea]